VREIKYQAFLRNEKMMVNVAEINTIHKFIRYYDTSHCKDGAEEFEFLRSEEPNADCPFEFCNLREFTGLKDKSGREIYGGDILKIPIEINHRIHGDYAFYEVIYRNGMWLVDYLSSEKGFILPRGYLSGELIDFCTQSRKSLVLMENEASLDEIEIGGNIYENPELLEGAAE
jgi:uncharacterized phage protein (TIGR01671 family)